MATELTNPTLPPEELEVIEFARAFRAAARAVGFYPPSHPTVDSTLQSVTVAAKSLAAGGSACLTILPGTFLVRGVPVESAERVVSELASILHRHGIGALNLDGRASVDSWRAFLVLLSSRPEDVRAAGGIQRQWKTQRHPSPGILEIDFGELLRGRIGGDFAELAGVIGHYLEAAGIGASLADDVFATLKRALEDAENAEQAAAAIVRELRTAAHFMRVMQPERFDEVFRHAATLGGAMSEPVMSGLLARRGTPEAMQGTLDVAAAFIDRIPDEAASAFLARAVVTDGSASSQLTATLMQLLPDTARRRAVVQAAQQVVSTHVAFEANFLERWEEIERQLLSFSNRQFVSAPYARELDAAQNRSAAREMEDPPERVAEWVRSIDREPIHDLGLAMLTDLSRIETDPVRWRDVLAILRTQVLESAEAGDWTDCAAAAEAVARVASEPGDSARRPFAVDVLQELSKTWILDEAIAKLVEGEPAPIEALSLVLQAIGPPVIPALLRRWVGETDSQVRARIEHVVLGCGRPGREALRRLLSADDPDVQCASIKLLQHAGGAEHLPVLESMLTNANPRIQREALHALAATSGRGRDLLARGIARSDDVRQAALIELVQPLGAERAVPVLRQLLMLL
ncbi:MAG: HEAT repeat domain-containing protein, partial [Acidobacteria bacterium]|nr:HEAT repeat domain-containing protein [Acidobacteriota bacterium]